MHQSSIIVTRQLPLHPVVQQHPLLVLQTPIPQSILNHTPLRAQLPTGMKVLEEQTEEPFLQTLENGVSLVKSAQEVPVLHALPETIAMIMVLLLILHSVLQDIIVIKMLLLLMEQRLRDLLILRPKMVQFAQLGITV